MGNAPDVLYLKECTTFSSQPSLRDLCQTLLAPGVETPGSYRESLRDHNPVLNSATGTQGRPSRRDELIIARHFNAGSNAGIYRVPQGRLNFKCA